MSETVNGNPHLEYGHLPVLRPKIVLNPPRPPAELVEQFKGFFLPDIADAVGQLYVMESHIRPLYLPIKRMVGVALTVKMPPGDNCTIHRAFRMVQAGDVLVVDARGYAECCGSGAGSLTPPITRGLVGVVIDGGWRDVAEFQSMDFPIFGKGISPFSPPKGRPGEINVPVCCGGVIVHPGDIVVCDVDGGVVVPREEAAIVAESLSGYQAKVGLEAWDVPGVEGRAKIRDNKFEELFKARGGIYVEWSQQR